MVMRCSINKTVATMLTGRIGYLKAAELAHESMQQHRTIHDLAVEKGILTKEEADAIFDMQAIARNRYREEKR